MRETSILGGIALLIGVLIVLAAGLCFLAQIAFWLWYGQWLSLDVIQVLSFFYTIDAPNDPVVAWAFSPKKLLGLHKLLSYLSAPLLAALFGVFLMTGD